MLIGGDLSRLTRRVRPVLALAPLLRREAADKGKEATKSIKMFLSLLVEPCIHTITVVVAIVIVIVVIDVIDVKTTIQSSIDDSLVLAGCTVFAVALARTASHEPYGVGNEFHWGAEDRSARLGARRAGP